MALSPNGIFTGVNFFSQDSIQAQTRTTIVTSGAFGFPDYVRKNKTFFESIRKNMRCQQMVIYGEWCGRGVQNSVALTLLKEKIFCIFAVLICNPDSEHFVVEPDEIRALVECYARLPSNTYILPWFADSRLPENCRVNLKNPRETEAFLEVANALVTEIDYCDPWVESEFGVRGPGEGLVWYPVSSLLRLTAELIESDGFKTKGDAHMVQKLSTPAQLALPTYNSPQHFVECFCTAPRMEQALTSLEAPITRSKFVEWLRDDVHKEGFSELGKLSWPEVEALLREFAAEQYHQRSIAIAQMDKIASPPGSLSGKYTLHRSLSREKKQILREFIVEAGGQIVGLGGTLVAETIAGALTPAQLLDDVFSNEKKSEQEYVRIPRPRVACRQADQTQYPQHYDILDVCVLHLADFEHNINKFYSLELHVAGNEDYRIYSHHGRTEKIEDNTPALRQVRFPASLEQAKQVFESLKAEKLSSDKGYVVVNLSKYSKSLGSPLLHTYQAEEQHQQQQQQNQASGPLDAGVKSLVEQLFAEASTAVSESILGRVSSAGVEMPLGVLSPVQATIGLQLLQEMEEAIQAENESLLQQLNSAFFSRIPHKLGLAKSMVQQSLLKTTEAVLAKRKVLQLVRDIASMQHFDSPDATEALYHSLARCIKIVDRSSPRFRILEKQCLARHAKSNGPEFSIVNIFALRNEEEMSNFKQCRKNTGNVKILVHGSPAPNVAGLLAHGILPPAEVEQSGLASRRDYGLLGAGVYFSDNIYSSLCYAKPASTGSRYLLLARVALGKSTKTNKALPELTAAPEDSHSVIGLQGACFRSDEYTVFKKEQYALSWLVEVKAK